MRPKNNWQLAILLLVSLLSSKALFAVAPSVTSLTPTSAVAGVSVTIKGTNFGATQGTSTVVFNGTTASPTSWANTSIKVPVPAAATTGNVVVTVNGVASNGVSFTVLLTPSITSLSPSSGPVGAVVTISGKNFGATQGTSTVVFDKTTATPTAWSSTSIQVPVPTGAATGNVVVTVSGVASSGVSFTVLPTPSITSLTPTSGAVLTSVTIKGTNFGATQSTSTVVFNGTTATPTTWANTSIKVPVPTGAMTGNVVVTVNGVPSNGISFTVLPTPSITSLTPSLGPVGAVVTISGTNFGATQGTSTVVFDKTTATPTAWNSSSIQVPVPTGAATGNVVVTVDGVASNGVSFTVLPTPSITSLTPTSGAVLTSVTIKGTNFGTPQGTSTVTFNGTPATATTWANTSIKVPVPAGATTGYVVVTVNGVPSNGVSFIVPGTTAAITSLSPTSGPAGSQVSINGSHFGSSQGSNTVSFNGTLATNVVSWTSSLIVATVPSAATSGYVVVTVGGVASNGVAFTVLPTPSITTLSPTSGPVGTSVMITGTNFGSTPGMSAVAFNGTSTTPSSWGATSIVAPVPSGATTGNVVVTVNGISSAGVPFTVLPTPSITTLSPASGAVGTSVTIMGTNFGAVQGMSTVTFNGTTAMPSSWSASSITAPVPSGATSGNVVVTVGGVASNGSNFTVVFAPTITNLSPTTGLIGTAVTITGTNFGSAPGASTVAFNATPATSSSWSSTSIVVPVPAGATSGPVSVTVGGLTATGPMFTVGNLPAGWSDSDVGAVGVAGSASYANGTFTASGAGTAFYATPDAFNFLYQSLSGDGSIVAQVGIPIGTGIQAGVMIRETLDPSSDNANTVVSAPCGSCGLSFVDFNVRLVAGGSLSLADEVVNPDSPFWNWVEIVRSGSTFSSYASPDGVNWTLIGTQTITMAQNAYVGLVVTSSSTQSLATVTFNNVSVSSAAAPAPVITSVSSTKGTIGSQVVITGSNFGALQGGSLVTLNATPATVNSWSNTSITITIPSGATSGLLVVSVAPSMNDSNPVDFTVTAQPWPSGWMDADVGAVGIAGSSSYANGAFTVSGGGIQLYGTADAFHFVYQTLSGDGSIVARVSIPAGTQTQAGVMIRQSLDAGSPNGASVASGSSVQFDVRTVEDGSISYSGGVYSLPSPSWVELARSGSTFTSYASSDGVNWTTIGSQTINMPPDVFVGLVVDGGISSPSMGTATFDSVSINSSAAPAPVITSVSATTGSVGSQVVITGSNFGAVQGSSAVTLNLTPVIVNSWSETSISIMIPAGAVSGPLVVSVAPSMNDSNPITFTVTGQPLVAGWLDADVGLVGIAGSSSYANGIFTVNGAGGQFSGTADAFHFVYQPLNGDGSLVAQVMSLPLGTGATAGVMIRQSLDPESPNAATVDSSPGSYVVEFNVRTAEGASTSEPGALGVPAPPYWVKLVRSGSTFSSYASPDGVNWTLLGNQTISMTPNVYVGLVVNSGNTSSLAIATFDNVSVSSAGTPAPAITSVSATTGTIGSTVVITGANFGASQGASLVTLNATPAIVKSWSNTSISITIPSGATSGPLVVSVAPSMNASNPVAFTVTSQPLPSGWLDGDVGAVGTAGNSSYANGTFTVSGAGSQFSGTADAFHFVYQPVSGDGTIVAQVVSMPTGAAAAGVMIRETLDPSSANGTAADYVPYGAYIQFSVRTTAGGNTSYPGSVGQTTPPYWIELTRSGNSISSSASPDGMNWTPIASQTVSMAQNVYVGLAVNSGTSSLATATFANVTVSFSPPILAPSITSLSPSIAVPTASVTITGANFGSTQGTSTVTFNGTLATPTNWNATTIAVPVPAGATSGDVVVTVNGEASNGMPFTVSQAPSITGLTPSFGTVGTLVTITGVNFGATQGTSTVAFNGTPGTATSWSATSIVVPVPSGATTGNVVVTVGGAANNGIPFTVLQIPGITSLSTASATIGALVTITGTNFGATQGASTVTFNGTGGTPSSWSATSIIVPVPLGATTGNVVVTVNGVPSNPVSLTVVLVSLPAVSQVQPANGATGVSENGRVIVRFAQPLPSSAVATGTVSLFQGENSIVGTLALSNDGLSVTFKPAANLPANSTFTVTATDVTGNQTTPEFQSTFTTGSTTDSITPTVVQTSPQSDATGVPISAPIVVQFSNPMDPSTLTLQAFTVNDPVTGPVPGMIQVDPAGTTASFIPQGFLSVGRTFSAILTSAIEDSSGNALEGSNTYFSFTTAFTADTTPPQMLGISPSSGATAVALNALITLDFSKPIDVISASNGLQVEAGGQPVSGAIALSNSDQQVTFTPLGGLAANTAYTVVTSSQITDVGGLALANPGTFSLTTGAATDTTTPSVASVSPSNSETGVPVNAVVQLHFSKPVIPWTVTASTFLITYGTNSMLTGTISVSTDGQTATLTPGGQLNSFTTYYVQATGGITDVEGHALSGFGSSFTTGLATDTSGPTVVTVSPANGANGTPANVRVDLMMSAPLSAASVGSNAVALSAGGVPVTGTVTLSTSGTILTFVPANLLAASTTYTVTASGFTDQAGNAVVRFTSSFTTGTSGAANTTVPTVVSVSPVNGASGVSAGSLITLTFDEAVDATTVNDATVPISVSGIGGVLAGGYRLDSTGTVVTFTPLSPLPGNSTITVQVTSGVLDLSGNASNGFSSTFTTGTGTNTTAPVVTMLTPQNGATGIGPNAVVVLTFSESLNPGTINTNSFGLLANGNALVASISTSADNRVVTLTPYGLPVSGTITVLVTSAVTDLSGNALANFQSQFTTAATATAPAVVSQQPGNGATGVPLSTNLVLYMSEAMNASTVQTALQVSQNGAAVSGTTQATENGQVIQFTPSTPWQPGALVQVFLSPAAQSASGISVSNYQSSFTTLPDTSTTPPVLIATNPVAQVNVVPTNVVIDFAFNEALDPNALLPDTVNCSQTGVWFQTGVSLLNGGTILQVTPRLPLAPNASTTCLLGNGIQGVNGLPLSYLSNNQISFTTGAGADTVVPIALTTSPPNGSSNVGDNAGVVVVFNKAINPLTVNASTIQLSAGGVTAAAGSISFSNGNQNAQLVPQAPLPDGTQVTLTISGVTDVAGNAMAAQTTQFTTGTGPDVVPPVIVTANPSQGAQNVPLNSIVVLQMSQPVDPGTVSSSTLTLVSSSTGQTVPGTYSLSADGLTITFVPGAPLAANSGHSVNFPGAGFGTGISDLAGNSLQGTPPISFTTGTTASTSAPQVTGVSPANGATAVPINAQVVIQFNEPVNAAQLGGVTLSPGSGTVNVSQNLTNGNQRLTLVPAVPLSPGTAYSLNVSGVQDLTGNLMSPSTVSFTTGTVADFTPAKVASITPASNATGVSANSTVTVTFSKSIDPLTMTTGTMELVPTSTNIPVAGTISSTGGAATFTPNQPLDLLTQYNLQLTSGITDMEGQSLYGGSFTSYFTTGQGTPAEPPAIASVVQASGFAGTPVAVNGTYFGTSQGGSTITFNGVTATPTSWADTQIYVPVPTGATSGPVVVTVNGVASNGFTFNVDATPTITSISPGSAAAGTAVTITGTNLGDAQDSILVNFNGVVAPPSSANETSLVVSVPAFAPAGTFNLTVNVNGYSGAGVSFTVIPTPLISGLNPSSGVSGTPVTITGNYFGATQGNSTVTFNGVPAASITLWSGQYITAVPPGNVTTGPVVVAVNSVTSNSSNVFTVANPVIASIVPPAAAPGSVVTINGSNFQPQGSQTWQVLFNGVSSPSIGCTAYYCSSETVPYGSLTAEVPSGASSGPVTVVIGGISSNSLPFTVEPQLTVTSMSPSVGPFNIVGDAVTVTISGTGFGATQSNSAVNFFGDVLGTTIVSWSDTSIQVWVPLDAASGPVSVQVGGVSAFAPTWFYTNTSTKLADSFGNQTQYTLNAQGGLWFASSSTGPGCVTCTLRGNITNIGDDNGNVLTTFDDLDNVTNYTYDGNNNLASVSKPLNLTTTATTSYTYNSFGEVLTTTDPLGNTTTNTYDSHGNMLSVTSPVPTSNTTASVTQFQYNTLGELTQITDPNGNVSKLTYSSVGLIASITDAQNNTTNFQYDSLGDRIAVIDALGNQTSFTYDPMSRLLGITYPDKSTASFTYDVRGRRITSTDQNAKTTTYTYDDADRLTVVTDPANNATQYAYDTEDNLLSTADANGHTTSFMYNNRGWMTQTTFPSTLAEYYTYDLVGNRLSKTDRNGNTIQYLYDALYRLAQKTYPNSTNVEYVYDIANKVLQVSDPTGTYGFAYDNMGRQISTTTQYAFLAGTYSNGYTYDAASNRTSLTAPDGSISTYGYDTLNRLNGLANSWAGSFGFSYDALGRRTQLTRPNGVNTNYSYDSLSHLLSVLHMAGMNTLDGASYTYDPAGNRTAKTNYLSGVASNYSYDPLYELTQVIQGASTTESYSYDPVGNRLSSSGVPTYNYNVSNELTSNSNGSYTYDNNGNTLTEANGNGYTWDFENRLAQAVVSGTSGGTTTFKYDPFGRRIQKSGPLGTTDYLYDGSNSIEEVDSGGNVLARYARTKNLDEPLSEWRSGTASYYQQDGLGSVTSLSNTAGALAETYTYDSFGRASSSTGTLTNPFQYTGREFDTETGLLFNRARYFDPAEGRFVSEDPIQFIGGVNFYRYTRNNPVVRTDPSGYQGACPPQSPNCVATDPDAPYQGPDGLWYNTLDWNGQMDPTPPAPDNGPSPPPAPSPAGPRCRCADVDYLTYYLVNSQVQSEYDWQRTKILLEMAGVGFALNWLEGAGESAGAAGAEKLPYLDLALFFYHLNDLIEIQKRAHEEVERRLNCSD
jgi:RHS repeat-associated protein